MSDFRQDFIRFAVEEQVLRFGEFVTKAGRLSPYFFNAGLFNHGASLLKLARFYAQAIRAHETNGAYVQVKGQLQAGSRLRQLVHVKSFQVLGVVD